MKRVLALFPILILLSTGAYAAPDRTAKVDVGINFSAGFPTEGDLTDEVYIGGNIARGINEQWAVGFSGGWLSPGMDVQPSGESKFDGGEIEMVPLFGDIIWRIPTGDSPFAPYAVIGLGAMITDTNGTGVLNDRNLEAQSEDSFALKVAGGVDWFSTANWIFNVEGGYVFTDAEVEITNKGTNATVDDKDLSFWYIGGGVKYLFD